MDMTAALPRRVVRPGEPAKKISSPKLKKGGLSEYAVLLRVPFNPVMGR